MTDEEAATSGRQAELPKSGRAPEIEYVFTLADLPRAEPFEALMCRIINDAGKIRLPAHQDPEFDDV